MAASHLPVAPRPGPETLHPEGVVRSLPERAAPGDDLGVALAAAQGDPRAAASVWNRYSTLVRGVLCRSLGPSDELPDLVQEVFLRFFKQIKTLRDPSALRSFLIGITLRVARSELRRRRVRRWLRLTDTGVLPEEATTRPSDPHHALTRLYAILDTLEDRGRLAFAFRYFEGYELTEVSAALGCSLATTKRHLARAEERIHRIIRNEPIFAPYLDRKDESAPHPEDLHG
jgi:RNA polymerase sigma-70 factor (ECF subfamily)